MAFWTPEHQIQHASVDLFFQMIVDYKPSDFSVF